MDLQAAVLSFDGVTSAEEAYAAALKRSSRDASWSHQVGFVEHHHDGHLVFRGTFAGRYVDADEALHVSERGAAEGWAIGAVIGGLLGPPGFAVGSVAGATIGSQIGPTSETDAEPQPFAERLRAAIPRSSSAIVLIADAHDVDGLLAVADERAVVTRKTLGAEQATELLKLLSAWPRLQRGRQGSARGLPRYPRRTCPARDLDRRRLPIPRRCGGAGAAVAAEPFGGVRRKAHLVAKPERRASPFPFDLAVARRQKAVVLRSPPRRASRDTLLAAITQTE